MDAPLEGSRETEIGRVLEMMHRFPSKLTGEPIASQYLEFASFIDQLILCESNTALVERHGAQLMTQLVECFSHTLPSAAVLTQTIGVVGDAFSRYPLVLSEQSVTILLRGVLEGSLSHGDILAQSAPVFRLLFHREEMFPQFLRGGGFVSLFRLVFFELGLPDAAHWCVELFFCDLPTVAYVSFPLIPFFDRFVKQYREIVPKVACEALSFIAHLVSCLSMCQPGVISAIVSLNVLPALDDLSQFISDLGAAAKCYEVLLGSLNDDLSDPPNLIVLSHVYELCKARPHAAALLFQGVLDVLELHGSSGDAIGTVVPVVRWFDVQGININQYTRMLLLLKSVTGDLV
jgi:hypothetical protein